MSPEVKKNAKKVEKIFRKDPLDRRLKTHKLNGKLASLWSFLIDSKHRIIFEYGPKNMIYFHSVGNHDIYK